VELAREVGKALARETRSKSACMLLGPTVNIHRSPLGGRNFEVSALAGPFWSSLNVGPELLRGSCLDWSDGIGIHPRTSVGWDIGDHQAFCKLLAAKATSVPTTDRLYKVCNDSETDRRTMSVVVEERTLREIYLRPFQIAFAKASPWGMMTSYNKVEFSLAWIVYCPANH
jgi:beta-glucosidase